MDRHSVDNRHGDPRCIRYRTPAGARSADRAVGRIFWPSGHRYRRRHKSGLAAMDNRGCRSRRRAHHFLRADRPGRARWLCAVERRAGVSLLFPTDSDGRAAAEHGGRYNKLRAARDTVFHLRRRHHGAGRPQPPVRSAGPGGRRPHTRRIAAGHCREHVPRVGYVGFQGSGCSCGRFGNALDVTAPRLRHGGGHCGARGIRRHGRDYPAQHRHVGSGLDHHFVDGIAFRCRSHPGCRSGCLPHGGRVYSCARVLARSDTACQPAGNATRRLRSDTSAADARHHRRGRAWRHRDANGGFLLRGRIRPPPGHAAVPRDGRSQAAQRSRRIRPRRQA